MTARADGPSAPHALARRHWLIVFAISALAGALSLGLMLMPAHLAADVTHYKYWAKLVAIEGVSGAYSGAYPETASIYPPLTMYGYRAAGLIYQRFFDPMFDMDGALGSRALTILVKLVAVAPHLVSIPVLAAVLARSYGPRVALVGALAYGLNPAALFNFAYWGQPDGIHAVLLTLAVWQLEEDHPLPAWAVTGLALATKPQAWALLPFIGYVSLRRFGVRRTVVGGVVAVGSSIVVCLPFLVYGTYSQILILPRLITETMPVASANAHNLWWIVTGAQSELVFDSEPVLASLTYRQAAALLTIAVVAYTLWRTNPRAGGGHLLSMAGLSAFGWFIVTTRAHENHAFFVLPLLLIAAPGHRFLVAAFAIVSVTLFSNMVLHDFSLTEAREALLGGDLARRLQLLNAAVNVGLLVAWLGWSWRRPPASPHVTLAATYGSR